MRIPTATVVALSWLILPSACSSYNLAGGKGNDADSGAFDADTDADADADADDTGDFDGEEEDDFLALAPAETETYVFVANPTRGTITRITADDLSVRTVEVGENPEIVLTTPPGAEQRAAVFNRGDDAISIVEAETMEQRVVEVRDNYNAMVMSPDGEWVALFHDIAAEKPDDPEPEGLESFNEASFVNLDAATHSGMAVGFNPTQIRYTADSSLAVVVSDEYLALVDLTAEPLVPTLVQVAADPLNPLPAEEVVLSPDNQYAFVRQLGSDSLTVVDLTTRLVDQIPVGLNPTDVDVSADGSQLVVLCKAAHQIWLLDIADPFASPVVLELPDSGYGSVLLDPTGSTGLLYTNSALVDRYASWDLTNGTITERALVKPVQSMAVTPSGDSLMVFHTLEDAADADPESPFFGSEALTLVALSDFRTNPLKLPAATIGYANADNGAFGYFIMEKQHYLEQIDYSTLLYEQIPLKSDPVYVGVLPDLEPADGDQPPAWASQDHDLGRITFYDPDDGRAETITGFELNSHIED